MPKKDNLYKLPNIKIFEDVCRAKAATKCKIAEALGISHVTLNLWLEKKKEYAEVFLNISNEYIELSEHKIKQIVFGDYSKNEAFQNKDGEKMTVSERIQLERLIFEATKFYLTHQARDRGWGDELGLNINKGQGLEIDFEGNKIKFNS